MSEWKIQPWMGEYQKRRGRWDTHDEALDTISSAGSVTTLSYEEAALCYARSRGFIVDGADLLCASPRQEQT